MSGRSFSVFLDTPSTSTSAIASPGLRKSSTNVLTPTTSLSNLASTIEKENLHPLTGERSGATIAGSKKRKTSVLASKVVPSPLAAKKPKDSKSKSRKSSSSSPKKTAGKKEKASSSARKMSKRSPRKPTLPRVDEEVERERERERLSQVDADSRCYELTVQPLADVTHAYEHSVILEEEVVAVAVEKGKARVTKESSLEPEIRDFFSSSQRVSPAKRAREPSAEPPFEAKAFSTPERKRIYSAFTFTSPSPSSERFSASKAGITIPRLSFTTASP